MPALKSLVRIRLFLLSPSIDDLVLTPPLDEVLVWFPWSSGLWRTHWTFPERCHFYHQYYFPSLVLFTTLSLGYYRIQGARSLMKAGSHFFASLLDISDSLFESSAIFWATPTRARIWLSLRYLVDHFPDARTILYFFRYMDPTCSDMKYLSSSHSLLMASWSHWIVEIMRWSRGWIFPHNLRVGFPSNGDLIHPFRNLYVVFVYIIWNET